MPYVSEAQRKFMHARKPKIAAKWDAEIKTKKIKVSEEKPERSKDKVSKTRNPHRLRKLSEEALNQLQSAQDIRRKKGRVKKMYAPASDDPYYNTEVAQKVFDLVMKMDDAEAELFCEMVMGDIFETTVEENLSTLQRHLNRVVAKSIADMKQAGRNLVSKGCDTDEAIEFAKAIDQFEGLVSKDWDSYLHPRGGSENAGRFRTKVSHAQTRPYSDRQADNLGLLPTDATDRQRYGRLTSAQKAQYQDEYQQLARFLSTLTQSAGAGDHKVYLHLSDRQGNEYREMMTGGAPRSADHVLLDPSLQLTRIEATPTTLTLGGASFGLAQAFGGVSPGPSTATHIQMLNEADTALPDFQANWNRSIDPKAANSRLYSRTQAGGKYLGAFSPPGSKMAMAGKLAEVVGSHGPEAEAVIGPRARKTAYRYRGTEKAPDKNIVTLYGRAIAHSKSGDVEPDDQEIQVRGTNRAEGELASRRATRVIGSTAAGEPPAVGQQARQAGINAGRAPTWAERSAGRRVIEEQLKFKLPKGDLYGLQLSAGNTPPSEGIMLDAQGRIASQAVGYGDDHYLPFNLKNLKALKGGEYVRTRSVGGLTSEDIYTGLITGARRVTVVSRSGTFSVEFDQDFRGGRRYNDKAARMTRRYEQILDAVQSKQVKRAPIPPAVEQAIRDKVTAEYPRESRTAVRARVKALADEYRQDPDMSAEDEKIARMVFEQGMKDQPSRDAREYLVESRQMVMAGKKFNYKLDAEGYAAGQDALAEQFPYYIRSIPVITQGEEQRVSSERDRGYVEPGRNRPTEARAGLYGTETSRAVGAKPDAYKFSASQADYQRGRLDATAVPVRGDTPPVNPTTVPATPAQAAAAGAAAPGTTAAAGARAAQIRQQIAAGNVQVHAMSTWDALSQYVNAADQANQTLWRNAVPQLTQTRSQFAATMATPGQPELFAEAVSGAVRTDAIRNAMPAEFRAAHRSLTNSVRQMGAQEYTSERGTTSWPIIPMRFDDRAAYQAGPGITPAMVDEEKRRLSDITPSLLTGRPLNTLTDAELALDWDAVRQIKAIGMSRPDMRDESNAQAMDDRQVALTDILGTPGFDQRAIQILTHADTLADQHLENYHRMRALNQISPPAGAAGATRQHPALPAPTPGTPTPGTQSQVGTFLASMPTVVDTPEEIHVAELRARSRALSNIPLNGTPRSVDAQDLKTEIDRLIGYHETQLPIPAADLDTALTESASLLRSESTAMLTPDELRHYNRLPVPLVPQAFTTDAQGYVRPNYKPFYGNGT